MPAKHCPLCHRASDAIAWQCHCGYEFGQEPAKVLVLIDSQITNARLAFVLSGSFVAAAAGAMVFGLLPLPLLVYVLALIAGVSWGVRSAVKISMLRTSRRQLSAPRDELPKAVLRQRRRPARQRR